MDGVLTLKLRTFYKNLVEKYQELILSYRRYCSYSYYAFLEYETNIEVTCFLYRGYCIIRYYSSLHYTDHPVSCCSPIYIPSSFHGLFKVQAYHIFRRYDSFDPGFRWLYVDVRA